MINVISKYILIGLILFTPIAFGSIEVWAFSIMELGILAIISLWIIQRTKDKIPFFRQSSVVNHRSSLPLVLLSLFLCLVLLQMVSLPPRIIGALSPKALQLGRALSMPESSHLVSTSNLSISFVPFATQVEFFKWFALVGFFLFFLNWNLPNRLILNLIPVIMWMGVAEAFYGMFEFFTGHLHILNLEASSFAYSVTGTFINPNYFAGYLLMVIPLSIGYLFSKGYFRHGPFSNWRQRLLALDGKDFLIFFGILLMVLGLIFSASRMGILSLLLALSLVGLFTRRPEKGRNLPVTSLSILALAVLWAGWIGLDAVIGRFFNISEDFQMRWRIWSDTFQISKEFPFFGTGLGTFSHIFPLYRSFHIKGLITHAENDFLQLTSEVGVVGVGLLLVLFLYLLFHAVSRIRSLSRRDPRRSVAIGGLVGVLALMLHSLVERNLQIPANAFLYTFIWALIVKISEGSVEQGNSRVQAMDDQRLNDR